VARNEILRPLPGAKNWAEAFPERAAKLAAKEAAEARKRESVRPAMEAWRAAYDAVVKSRRVDVLRWAIIRAAVALHFAYHVHKDNYSASTMRHVGRYINRCLDWLSRIWDDCEGLRGDQRVVRIMPCQEYCERARGL
jgi:hypothetical protein